MRYIFPGNSVRINTIICNIIIRKYKIKFRIQFYSRKNQCLIYKKIRDIRWAIIFVSCDIL